MVLNFTVNNKKFYRGYVEILNASLGLSNRELDILAVIFELDMLNKDTNKNVIDTKARKYIMNTTLVNKYNLCRYINKYKEKKIIVQDNGGWVVEPSLIPIIEDDKVQMTFNINIVKE
jgi:hypothetical protein